MAAITFSKISGYDQKVPGYIPSKSDTEINSSEVNVAADNTAIPIIYGRQRVQAKIATITKDTAGSLIVCCIWCMGEVEAIENILVDDKFASSYPDSGVTVVNYTGTTAQTADPQLAALLTDYTDTLVMTDFGYNIGVCYSVITILKGAIDNFPTFEAIIQGRKVYDPRTAQLENDKTTWTYSTNSSLCLADFLASNEYGWGRDVDWSTVDECADYNDEIIPTTSIKRHEINISIDSVTNTESIVEGLRAYAHCFLRYEGTQVTMVPDDVIGYTPIEVTESSIVQLALKKNDITDIPTVCRISYTNTEIEGVDTEGAWKTPEAIAYSSGVEAGTTQRRESLISMLGYTVYNQAYREAIQRLNYFNLSALYVSWQSTDEALEYQVGDVVNVTHRIGLTSKSFRISEVKPTSAGRWTIIAQEYNAAIYTDDATLSGVIPGYIYTPDVIFDTTPDVPTGLDHNQITIVSTSGTVDVTTTLFWVANTGNPVTTYTIAVKNITDGDPDFTYYDLSETRFIIPQSLEDKSLEAKVRANNGDKHSAYTTVYPFSTIGDTTGPGQVTNIAATQNRPIVDCTWTPPVDNDYARTEVWGSTVDDSTTAIFLASGYNSAAIGNIEPNTAGFLWFLTYDTTGNAGAAISGPGVPASTVIAQAENPDFSIPAVPTGLAVDKTAEFSEEGNMTLTATVTWNANTDTVSGYTLSYNLVGDPETSYMDVSEPLIIVSGIVPDDATYELAVRAVNGSEQSAFSTPKVSITFDTDVTDPGPPSALSATHAPGISTLIWTNPSGVDNKDFKQTHVYASATDSKATALYMGAVGGNTMTFTNLESGVTWYIWLQAEDFSGNVSTWYPTDTTGWSTTTGGDLTYETPAVPTNLQVFEELVVSQDGTSLVNIRITWDAVAPPVTSYLLKATHIEDGAVGIVELPSNEWVVNNVVVGDSYKIEIAAKYMSSASAYGTSVTVLIDGVIDGPSPPSGFGYTSALGNVTLDWTNPPEDDFSYTELRWSITDDEATAIVVASVSTDTYTFSDIIEGSVHYFWLQSFNSSKAGSTLYPATVAGHEVIAGNNYQYATPSVPAGLAVSEAVATNVNGINVLSVTISWNAVAVPVTGYTLYIKDTVSLAVAEIYTQDLKLVFTNLIPGNNYDLQIRAENYTTSSAYSTPVVNTTIVGDITPPGIPTGFAYTVNYRSVDLSWTNPTDDDLKDVLVYFNTVDTFATSTLIGAYDVPETTYTDLDNGIVGYMWLKARDTDNNLSDPTASLAVVSGETQDITRMQLLEFPLPDAATGVVTPDFDTQANSFRVNITGSGVTINAPTYTLDTNESIEGYLTVNDGLTHSVAWGTGWNWDGTAPTFTNKTIIHYRVVSGDASVKAWLIGDF